MAALYRQLKDAIDIVSVEDVKSALQNGADPNYGGQNIIRYFMNRYSFHSDSIKKYKIVRILLEAGANPNYAPDAFPLIQQASSGHPPKLVEMLLKAGANPNVPTTYFPSVLHSVLGAKERTGYGSEPIPENVKLLCEATNYDEVERLKQLYPQYAHLLNCQVSKADIAKNMGAVETALDRAAAKMYPELQDGVELPHVMKNVKEYVGYKNVGPGGRRRKTKKRKSSKKKTKKRK